MGPLCPCPNSKKPMKKHVFGVWEETGVPAGNPHRHRENMQTPGQGRTDNSWGPRAIGDHGAPVSLPKLKKAYEKRYQWHLMGLPTDPGPSGSALVSKWSVRPCS
ncbi:unnamed protein product, partial [Staurois parvus]